MISKMESLQNDVNELSRRLAELETERVRVRANMQEDPIHTAVELSTRYAQVQVQIEVFGEKLAILKKQLQAEEARLNSPEMKAKIRTAEGIVIESKNVALEVNKELLALQRKIENIKQKQNQASALFQDGGRGTEGELVINGIPAVFLDRMYAALVNTRNNFGPELVEFTK